MLINHFNNDVGRPTTVQLNNPVDRMRIFGRNPKGGSYSLLYDGNDTEVTILCLPRMSYTVIFDLDGLMGTQSIYLLKPSTGDRFESALVRFNVQKGANELRTNTISVQYYD